MKTTEKTRKEATRLKKDKELFRIDLRKQFSKRFKPEEREDREEIEMLYKQLAFWRDEAREWKTQFFWTLVFLCISLLFQTLWLGMILA